MDKNKQRMISSMGGKASRNARRRPEKKDEQDAEGKDRVEEGDAFQKDLSSLEDEDEREIEDDDPASLSYSETDDDEDEGLGDGNLGRTARGGVGDE